jgi:curved DNA-binding protein CbpA
VTTTVFVDYYEILGVDSGASSAEIKSAYRARMVRDHADQNPGDELAQERMILLTRAKATLLDEQRRLAFDRDRDLYLAAVRLGMAPPRWNGGRAPEPVDGTVHRIEVDLRDVPLGRLIVGVGVAAVVTGLGLAAKVVADRASRRRRRNWF